MDKLMYDAFEEIREYILENNMDITCKDDLLELFIKMRNKGFFSEVKKEKKMRVLREKLSVFCAIYEKDPTILDPTLIVKGPKKVLEKIEKYPVKKHQ